MAQAIYDSSLSNPGKFRHLYVDRYLQKDNRKAVVMINGFIENGYWYQIDMPEYSLAEFVAELGFDVHVLSFIPNRKTAKDLPFVLDASFQEIVTLHLPNYHDSLSHRYEALHYVGHSYGVTLLLCFLLGYQPKHLQKPQSDYTTTPELARALSKSVQSVISLAGYFGFDSAFFKAHMPEKLRQRLSFTQEELTAQFSRIIDTVYKKGINKLLPFIPTHRLEALKYIPGIQNLLDLFKGFSPAFFPYISLSNTNLPAFHKAITNGSSPETWETLLTALGLITNHSTSSLPVQSFALHHFCEHLNDLNTPICFIQGEKDYITSPNVIKHRAYDQVRSPNKEFITLENYGHQDIFTAKNPMLLKSHLQAWLLSF